MSEEPKRLDPDVLSVLLQAKPIAEIPEGTKDRLLGAVEARIASLPAVSPALAPTGPASWVAAHPWLALSTALAIGGAVGAAARGATSTERIVYVDRPVPAVSIAASSAAPPRESASAVPVETLPAVVASATRRTTPAPVDSGQQLAAESALLDIARTALARGEPQPALDAVGRHAAQFPRGLLGEEREALAIKALVLAGRGQEARARAAAFRAQYPASMFARSIEASLATIE